MALAEDAPSVTGAGGCDAVRPAGGAPAQVAHGFPLDPAGMGSVVNRIKRAQGQLAGIVRLLEQGRDCEDVIVQLAAVSRAVDRAGFAVIAASLQQCLAGGAGPDSVDARRLERLFLSL